MFQAIRRGLSFEREFVGPKRLEIDALDLGKKIDFTGIILNCRPYAFVNGSMKRYCLTGKRLAIYKDLTLSVFFREVDLEALPIGSHRKHQSTVSGCMG